LILDFWREDTEMANKSGKPGGNQVHVGRDAIGSALGSQSEAKTGDITVNSQGSEQSSGLTAEEIQAFSIALAAVEKARIGDDDKADAKADLGKLKVELEKPKPDESRLKRLFDNVKAIVPDVATILGAVASLAKIAGFGGSDK